MKGSSFYVLFRRFVIDLFFPQKKLVKEIERMSPAEFKGRALRKSADAGLSFPVYSLFSYKDLFVQTAIHEIKYKKNERIGDLLAHILKEALIYELEDEVMYTNFIDPIIIPIPSHRNKQRSKGYNQIEFILEKLKRISNHEISFALMKIKDTPDQTHLKRADRLRNLQGSFRLKEEEREIIKGRNIIIFDDVVTTGGTLMEAEKILKRAEARRVIGMTLGC